MRKMNRCISVILAVVMIAGILPFSVFADPGTALPWDGQDVTGLTVGEPVHATILSNTPVYLSFTPEQSGEYTFVTSSAARYSGEAGEDWEGITLFAADGSVLYRSERYENVQRVCYALEGGETYYFRTGTTYYPYMLGGDWEKVYENNDDPVDMPASFVVVEGDHEECRNGEEQVEVEGSCYVPHVGFWPCEECGIRDYDFLNFEHSNEDVEVSTQPTCDAGGLMKQRCSVCGFESWRSMTKLGHIDEDLDGLCDDCKEALEIEEAKLDKQCRFFFPYAERRLHYCYFTPDRTGRYTVDIDITDYEPGGVAFYDAGTQARVGADEDGCFTLTAGVKYILEIQCSEQTRQRGCYFTITVPWSEKTFIDLEAEEVKNLEVKVCTPVYFRFTAPSDGDYCFMFNAPTIYSGSIDEYSKDYEGITLFDENGNELGRSEEHRGTEVYAFALEEGKTYYY